MQSTLSGQSAWTHACLMSNVQSMCWPDMVRTGGPALLMHSAADSSSAFNRHMSPCLLENKCLNKIGSCTNLVTGAGSCHHLLSGECCMQICQRLASKTAAGAAAPSSHLYTVIRAHEGPVPQVSPDLTGCACLSQLQMQMLVACWWQTSMHQQHP